MIPVWGIFLTYEKKEPKIMLPINFSRPQKIFNEGALNL
jgi:hypothetical protein